MRIKQPLAAAALTATLLMGNGLNTAQAIDVKTEILLLADVSGSLDDADFNLQRDGYAAAFQSAIVKGAIAASGPIAVSLVYWSDGQDIAVPWTLISNDAESDAFAAAILAAPRTSSGGTRMAAAMDFGTPLFNNNFESKRQVMDISGDGADTDNGFQNLNAPNVQGARDNALASGVDTINALWIDDRDFFGDDPTDQVNALDYGNLNVLGGASPFQDIAQNFSEFEQAIINKIGREVIPPTPDGGATSLLFGLGLIGFGFFRRFVA